jgi:hypothetical protein
MPKRLISLAALTLFLSGCKQELVQESPPETATETGPYSVAHFADYVTATECDVKEQHYNRALQTALDHLVFADILDEGFADNASYTRRHSRDFFEPLIVGEFGDGCLTPALRRITLELGFPEDDSELGPANAAGSEFSFALMSREEYMAETECLASPSTWNKYRLGFYTYVLGFDELRSEPPSLHQFLQELGEGRRTEDGHLDSACMTPTLRRIAESAGELDAEGRFVLD